MIKYMNITEDFFEKDNTCSEIIKLLSSPNIHKIIFNRFKGESLFKWFNQKMVKFMNQKQHIKYAMFAAELVLPIFERQFPYKKGPREVIDTSKKYLKDPSEENRKILEDAGTAAALDAWSVDSAIIHPPKTARDAAHAASYISRCSIYDNSSLSASRAIDAASQATLNSGEVQWKIIEYGLKLLEENK